MNDLVFLRNDEAMCDSLAVAEKFHKRHDTVLRAIDNLRKNVAVESRGMYLLSAYTDAKGEKRKQYLMNRKGFTILAMGFNGKDALEWKLKYSDAFDQMEAILHEKTSQAWIEARAQGKLTRKAETDAIQRFAEYAKANGSNHPNMYYKHFTTLANKVAGIPKGGRDTATVAQLINLTFMEQIIVHEIDLGIIAGTPYKEVFQNCKARLQKVGELAYLT